MVGGALLMLHRILCLRLIVKSARNWLRSGVATGLSGESCSCEFGGWPARVAAICTSDRGNHRQRPFRDICGPGRDRLRSWQRRSRS